MDLDTMLKFLGSGIVLHALELIEVEQETEYASEDEITERVEVMDTDEMIHGVAMGFRLMGETSGDYSEIDEAEFEETTDMFEEIHEYLRAKDEEG